MIDPSRHAVLWLLIGFVLTTTATRSVTRTIRHRADRAAERLRADHSPGVLRDLVIAGTHVHHHVWCIFTLLFTGLLFFTYVPGRGPLLDLFAFMFGAGAALTLDEFAMWLHLEDVYWAREGRTSVSALIVAVMITAALVVGANPLDVVPTRDNNDLPGFYVAGLFTINAVFVIVTILKGKLVSGLVGVFIPGIGFVGAMRLAKPRSWWAQHRYPPDGRSMRRAEQRFGPEYDARWDRVRDLIGGAPSEH